MTHWKLVFYLHLIQLQTSNFQCLQSGCISKIEKNGCSRCCCCCYSVAPPRIRQISRSYFFKQNMEIFLALFISQLCCFWPFSVFQLIKIKVRMCLHFDQIRKWHLCLKLCFFSLYIYVKYLNTFPSSLTMIEINFTRPLTSYNSSESINSALFSRAKSLRSPRLVKF